MDSLKVVFILLTILIMSGLSSSSCRSWIDDPCNIEMSQNFCRTKRSDHFFAVRNQLRIFIVQLKINMKKIDRMYVFAKKQKTAEYPDLRTKLGWLNVKKMLCKIKHSSFQSKQIENMFYALQKFAGTVVVLRNLTIDDGGTFWNEQRGRIYDNVAYQMRSLLCEVQYSQQVQSEQALKEIPLRSMGIPLLENSVDRRVGHLMDVTFFRKTLSFVKRMLGLLFRRKSGSSGGEMLRTIARV